MDLTMESEQLSAAESLVKVELGLLNQEFEARAGQGEAELRGCCPLDLID